MMYVISNVNTQKFQQLSSILNSAFGGKQTNIMPDSGNSILPSEINSGNANSMDNAQLAEIQAELEQYFKMKSIGGQVTVQLQERGLVISLQDTVLFDSGSAVLNSQAVDIITTVGNVIKPLPNYVLIEGHTDNLPIHNGEFPSNWELSSARATNVLQEVLKCGLAPQRLSATGYGEYRPRVPNDSDDQRQMNRRVDIVLLRTTYSQIEPH
jgi:chemotaxis protein MotB